jgi:hypothetical protein
MPVSTRRASGRGQASRRSLEDLWAKMIVELDIALSQEDEVADADLEKCHIRRIPFNFEELDNENANLSLEPPVLFCPLPLEILQRHSINISAIADGNANKRDMQMQFQDYIPPTDRGETDRGFWSPRHCARAMGTLRLGLVIGQGLVYEIPSSNSTT